MPSARGRGIAERRAPRWRRRAALREARRPVPPTTPRCLGPPLRRRGSCPLRDVDAPSPRPLLFASRRQRAGSQPRTRALSCRRPTCLSVCDRFMPWPAGCMTGRERTSAAYPRRSCDEHPPEPDRRRAIRRCAAGQALGRAYDLRAFEAGLDRLRGLRRSRGVQRDPLDPLAGAGAVRRSDRSAGRRAM